MWPHRAPVEDVLFVLNLDILLSRFDDRSICIRLVKAEPGQIVARFDEEHIEIETELCRKLARWTQDHFAEIQACDPKLPATAFNRLADTSTRHVITGPDSSLIANV